MKCFIEPLAALKMKYYVSSVDAEISGVGKTRFVGEDIFVEDVIIFKQKCTGAHTDIDVEDEMKVMYERDLQGESSKDWNLWWHSHNSMGVFWSGTDTKNIVDQASGGSYLLSIVTNNAGDFKTRLDTFPKDLSPFNVISSVLIKDNIETIILGNNYNPEREQELLTQINEIELIKETYKESLDKEYEKKTKEAEEQIQAWTDILLDSEKEKEEEELSYNTRVDEANAEIINEYTELASQELIDDEDLRKTIQAEVLLKVTTPTPFVNTGSKFLGWRKKDKGNSYVMSGGYPGEYDYDDGYDDIMYGFNNKKKIELEEEEIDAEFFNKSQDVKQSHYLDEENYPPKSQHLPLSTDDEPDFASGLINTTIRNQSGEQIGFKISK